MHDADDIEPTEEEVLGGWIEDGYLYQVTAWSKDHPMLAQLGTMTDDERRRMGRALQVRAEREKKPAEPGQLLTAENVAWELQVSMSEAYAIMDEMEPVKSGRAKRVTREALDAWKTRNRKSKEKRWPASTSRRTRRTTTSTPAAKGTGASRPGSATRKQPKPSSTPTSGERPTLRRVDPKTKPRG